MLYGDRSFAMAGPTFWNSGPVTLRWKAFNWRLSENKWRHFYTKFPAANICRWVSLCERNVLTIMILLNKNYYSGLSWLRF